MQSRSSAREGVYTRTDIRGGAHEGVYTETDICTGAHGGVHVEAEVRTGTQRCGACLSQPPAFDATIAAADYVPPVDQLVLALKFAGRLALAPLCARLLRDAVLSDARPQQPRQSLPTLLLAVPLGEGRLAARGFNQALEIARPLSRSLGIELQARLALRDRETVAQSLLHPDERQHNMRGAFGLCAGADVRGRHIGVVDDVITTGATLQEMALLLKRHGAARVTNLVFARTLPK